MRLVYPPASAPVQPKAPGNPLANRQAFRVKG
jgi:hypothetical protein